MILLTTDPREPSLRQWLHETAGTDSPALSAWFLEQHPTNFVEALAALRQETEQHGRLFLQSIIAFANKPKEVQELEKLIIVWANPRMAKAAAIVLGHRADENVVKAEFRAMCDDMLRFLRGVFPSQAESRIKSVMFQTFVHEQASFALDVPKLVGLLRSNEPLGMVAAWQP